MKIAYRIVTPIFALGAIAMGIFLDMFQFVIGSSDDQINNLVSTITGVAGKLGYDLNTKQGFSVFEILKMMGNGSLPAATAEEGEEAKGFIDLIQPIFPQLVAFLIIMAVIVAVLIAIAVCSASIGDKKKRNRTVYILSFSGLALMFANIIITNNAFSHITNGELDIASLVKLFSDNVIASLATAILEVTAATLSAGFYAMFGMFIVILIWTTIAGYVISSPIVPSKKAYKRKKPMRDPFAAKKAEKANAKSEK